jgi:hypothetical protein
MPNIGNGNGARDGDPISLLILIFMAFILLLWLSNASFTPWQGDFGCTGNPVPNCHTVIANGFNNAFNTLNNSGFMTLFIPLGAVMFAFYIYREFSGEDIEDTYRYKVQGEPRDYLRPQQEEEQDESDEGEQEV